jgi:DNA-binding NarL/FixJ family response regulator
MNGKAGIQNQPSPASLRFLLIEDQVLVREFLRRDLQEVYPNCTITLAGNLEEIRLIEQKRTDFDLTIVDLNLPDGNALEWVQRSLKARPEQRIVILSALNEDYLLYQAMHCAVPGYVHKNDKPEVLRQAIKTVLAGQVFYSPSILQMGREQQADPRFFNKLLTAREQEVLQSFGQGLADGEIAALLGISQFTVAAYRKQIMAKLDVHSLGELMKYAVAKGFSRLN